MKTKDIKARIESYPTTIDGFFREIEEETMLKTFFPEISIQTYYTHKLEQYDKLEDQINATSNDLILNTIKSVYEDHET